MEFDAMKPVDDGKFSEVQFVKEVIGSNLDLFGVLKSK